MDHDALIGSGPTSYGSHDENIAHGSHTERLCTKILSLQSDQRVFCLEHREVRNSRQLLNGSEQTASCNLVKAKDRKKNSALSPP